MRRIRVTDYIDEHGDFRCCFGHPSTANKRIGRIIGTRPAWSERYESIGGHRTWSEAREALGVDVATLDNTVN